MSPLHWNVHRAQGKLFRLRHDFYVVCKTENLKCGNGSPGSGCAKGFYTALVSWSVSLINSLFTLIILKIRSLGGK